MNPRLRLEAYRSQRDRWPKQGRHVLAQFDADTVVVYQAYRPSIGHYAAARQRLDGGGFSLGRMSWIKPNFLWMMFRSGWGTKVDQEVTLAIRIARAGFDALLADAVPSSFWPHRYASQEDWQRDVKRSQVRLQWDPDHTPGGGDCARRAVQLGMRAEALRRFVHEWTVDIEDISAFVAAERKHLAAEHLLQTPSEAVYPIDDPAVAARVGVDPLPV